MFLTRAAEKGDQPFLWAKRDKEWRLDELAEAARQVASLAASLKVIGLQPGDRVCLVSENRPEWLISDLAIMAAGCVTVPTYTTNTVRDHSHILENSGARAVMVSNQKLAKNSFRGADLERLPPCHRRWSRCVRARRRTGVSCHSWSELASNEADAARFGKRCGAGIGRDEPPASCTPAAPAARRAACGSTTARSSPICEGATDIISTDSAGATKSSCRSSRPAMPMSIPAGSTSRSLSARKSHYAESLEKLAANIEEVQPTIMVVVPRLFEMLRARIIKSIETRAACSKYLMRAGA